MRQEQRGVCGRLEKCEDRKISHMEPRDPTMEPIDPTMAESTVTGYRIFPYVFFRFYQDVFLMLLFMLGATARYFGNLASVKPIAAQNEHQTQDAMHQSITTLDFKKQYPILLCSY